MTAERRANPRVKVNAPIEIISEPERPPIRAETLDLSLGGCYVNMMFTLVVGTEIEIRLRVSDVPIIIVGIVRTCDPQVGNGIEFLRMLPEDRRELRMFLDAALESANAGAESPTANKDETIHA